MHCLLQRCGAFGVGVTLNQSLFENVLHSLLIDGRDHTVEMYQGNGAKWTKSRQAFLSVRFFILPFEWTMKWTS
jgi:hypothetical protein